jgi:hypothetical protein
MAGRMIWQLTRKSKALKFLYLGIPGDIPKGTVKSILKDAGLE